jgi:3',5'-cyclic AMP phosphodiesterase CpdA
MTEFDGDQGVSRRKVLECMTWIGTGVLWSISGGVPYSLGIIDEAAAQQPDGLAFLQISDSHIGFNKPVNPDVLSTLEQAIGLIQILPVKPSFMIHTGDISHLSKPREFDDADQIISQAHLDVHYVPGEHDLLDAEVKLYRQRYGRDAKGTGWYSFDAHGAHFVGLVNVLDASGHGNLGTSLGNLGREQLEWLKADLKDRSASTPIVVFAHVPLWMVYPKWGWGTEDAAQALQYLKRFGSVTVLNGHVHQAMQKVEGNVTFHTALSTSIPLRAPGPAASPGPMSVPADRLRSMLGIANITFSQNQTRLAIIDNPLQAPANTPPEDQPAGSVPPHNATTTATTTTTTATPSSETTDTMPAPSGAALDEYLRQNGVYQSR